MVQEARFTIQRFADRHSVKWQVLPWAHEVGADQTICLRPESKIKYCMRGSRVKWRSDVCMEDGVGLALVVN